MHGIMNLDAHLSLCTELSHKWSKELSRRPETLKLLNEKVNSVLLLIHTNKDFLNKTLVS